MTVCDKSSTCKTQQVALEIANSFSDMLTGKDVGDMTTKNGATQDMETYYSEIIEDIVKNYGFRYERASSQQPYDFRIIVDHNFSKSIHSHSYRYLSEYDLKHSVILLELKKTDSCRIMLNDTIPKENSFYLIIHNRKPTNNDPNKYIHLSSGLELKRAWNKRAIRKGSSITDIDKYKECLARLKIDLAGTEHPRCNIGIDLKDVDNYMMSHSFEIHDNKRHRILSKFKMTDALVDTINNHRINLPV